MHRRGLDLSVAALVAAAVVALQAPVWNQPGSLFDEGFALTYALEVLDGRVPHRDFESFYGPGNPWLLAGVFSVFGADQWPERAVGTLYRVVIAVGCAGLAWRLGRGAALAAGITAAVVLAPGQSVAFAAAGATAASLTALVLLQAPGRGSAAAGGVALGSAFLMRPDFLPGFAVAALVAIWGRERSTFTAFAAGLAPPALAGVVHAAIVGPDRIGLVIGDLWRSLPARKLPVDWLGSEEGRLLILLLAGAIGAGLVAWRSGRRPREVVVLTIAALALVPHATGRLDFVHVQLGLAVAAALPAALLAAELSRRVPAAIGGVLAAGLVCAVLALAAPVQLGDEVKLRVNTLIGRVDWPQRHSVSLDGRSLAIRSDLVDDVQKILAVAEAERRRGARTLFTGPRDLRRAFQNDVGLYYLLADFRPSSYYIELNPGAANRAGSSLADDLRRTDLVILDQELDVILERNDARLFGPDEPNRVVRELFCSLLRTGPFEVLRRCRGSRR